MNIVMICRLFSPHRGGVERHVEEVSIRAAQDGNKVVVVTSQHERSLAYGSRLLTSTEQEILVYRIPNLYQGATKTLLRKLADRVRIWRWTVVNIKLFISADIIHVHDVFWWCWPIKILLPWKKMYVTFHGFEAGSLPTAKAKKARRLAEFFTRGNICIGGWIEKWYGTKATYISYGAADCSSIQQKKKAKSEQRKALFVGRLEEDTGILSYIEAVLSMGRISLDIVGEGKLKPRIEKMIKNRKNIQLLGGSSDTCSLYGKYDVVFASSYLTMIEALQCQTPIIAYAHDKLKEDYLRSFPVSKDIAIVLTIDALKGALSKLSTPDMKEKTKKASEWARRQTWGSVYLLYRNIWHI